MHTLAEKIQEKFSSLPSMIQQIIDMPEFSRQVDDIVERYNLTGKMQEFDEIIWSLLFREIDTRGLLSRLQTVFSLSEKDARALAQEIVGKIFLLFPEYSKEYVSFYRELDGDLIEAYGCGILIASLPSHFQREILEQTGVLAEIRNMVTQDLLGILLRVEDEKKKALNTTVLLLLRSNEDVGRLLASDMAANQQMVGSKTVGYWLKDFIAVAGAGDVSTITIAAYLGESVNARQLNAEDKELLRNVLDMYRVLSTYPEGFSTLPREEWMAIPFKKMEKPITKPRAKIQEKLIQNEESGIMKQESGIEKQESQSLTPSEPMSPSMPLPDYPALIHEAIQASGIGDSDEETTRRLQNIVLTRMKNVRTAVETKEKLTTPKERGGAGLTDEQAEKVLKSVNVIADQILKGAAIVVVESGMTNQESGEIRSDKRDEIPSEKEREEMVKKMDGGVAPFNLPTAESSKQSVVSSQQIEVSKTDQQKILPPAMPDVTPHSTRKELPAVIESGIPTPEQVRYGARRNPSTRTSTVQGAQESGKTEPSAAKAMEGKEGLTLAIEEIDGIPTFVEKPNFAEASLGKPNTTETRGGTEVPHKIPITVRSAPQQLTKPAMADVKGPRLVDPVEELRIMTLKDFRRLSSDPMEAVKRLYQKIQLLEKESFTKKQAAIDAWHESEVNTLYMAIGKESFGKGLDIQQVIAKQHAEGKQTLSAQEFDALVELNEMMRF